MAGARDIFTTGSYVDGVVSYVEGPQRFYMQPLSLAADLRRLTKRLQVLYLTNLLGDTDYTMTLDQMAVALRKNVACWCAAPFHIDLPPNEQPLPDCYYRAIVMDRVGPSTIKVFFVDYGNTCIVPIASLKSLPDSCKQYPCMAVPCRLFEAETATIDGHGFRIAVDGYHVVAYVRQNTANSTEPQLPFSDDPVSVQLFMTDGKEELNVAEVLLVQPETGLDGGAEQSGN